MKNELLYHFKPYLIFILGFMCGGLDHPIKYVSMACLISASVLIEWWRYTHRCHDYTEIEIKGLDKYAQY